MPSTEIVGPVQRIHFGPFGERGSVNYTPPRDTLDPRFELCTNHHVACDCREAGWAEERQERRNVDRELRDAVDKVLAGHPTYAWEPDARACMCTGCQIVRLLGLHRSE